ncbi:spore cortex biosynthesis protein YabQ [Clostridium minihomine]|uniref:spore cortex biosynthesis protein YabQ n=1 Tax=Clostridium minihomine TaxID=2045012 RepID=UPI000C75EA29|nr:spore cortex biosynthesis protein YabQ [Clostridium minihomine]
MDLTLAEQGQGFLYALATGFALGAFYDIFRIWRVFVRSEKRQVICQDIFFCFIAAVASFLLALAINWGEIRFYLLAGEGIGLCAYFLTLGEVTLCLSRWILRLLAALKRFFMRWVMRPIKWLARKIWHVGKAIGQKMGRTVKNTVKNKNKSKKQLETTPPDSV